MRVPRPTRMAVPFTAAVLALAGCGGVDDEPVAVGDDEPSAACAAAFDDAAEAATAEGDLGLEGDVTNEADEEDAGNAADTSLAGLVPTLDSCTSPNDWLAGAREFREAVPNSIDAESALRTLCEAVDDDPAACAGIAEVDTNPQQD